MTTKLDISQYTLFPFTDFNDNVFFNTNYPNQYLFHQVVFQNENKGINYSIVDHNTKFSLNRNRFNYNNKKLFIICSKNNSNILKYCLKKLKTSTNIRYDILLVDDGSENDDILKISDDFETSYLRIDRDINIFNYSLINNIAINYAKHFDKETIIFYNNDLWPTDSNTLANLLDKHYNYKSDISSCRLLYPTEQEYINIDKPQHLLEDSIQKVYGAIQHGGIHFIPTKQFSTHPTFFPSHTWRYYKHDTAMANIDTRCFAVTGALQIINIDTFIELNAFNQSLSAGFQDIDLCLKASSKDMSVYYIGSESMYHAESLTIAQQQDTYRDISISDHILWSLLWDNKINKVLGYGNQKY